MATMLKKKDKAFLDRLAAEGRGKDSIIAHINPKEAALLRRMGGKGTPHPETGLLEFDGGGDGFTPGTPDPGGAGSTADAAAAQGAAQQAQRDATPFNLDSSYLQQLDTKYNDPNKVQDVINNATSNFYNDPSGFTQTPGGYVPTTGESANLTGWTDTHYTGGQSFLQGIEKGLGPTGIGPILPMLGVAGAAVGLEGLGLLGIGGAEAAGAAAEAGAGAVDAFGVPLAQGAADAIGTGAAVAAPEFGPGVVDLTSVIGQAPDTGLTGVSQIGDAGFSAGLTGNTGTGLFAGGEALGPATVGNAASLGSSALSDTLGTGLNDVTSQLSSDLSAVTETAQAVGPAPGALAGDTGVAAASGDTGALAGDIGADFPVPPIPPDVIPPEPGSSFWNYILGGGGAGGASEFGKSLLGDLGNVAKIAGPVVSGASLASSLNQKSGVNALPQGPQLQGQANQLQSIGNQLTSPLLNGTPLPAGAQAALDQSMQAQKAHLRSTFAGLGMQGSTEETTALNQVDQQTAAQTYQIASQMATQGISAIGGANAVYTQLMQAQLQQDQALQKAIANFSSALAGGTNTKTIQLGVN